MTSQAIASFSARRTVPYLGVDMFKWHKRQGLNLGALAPGGRESDQDAALASIIDEASAWVDDLVLTTLASTLDTYLGGYYVNRDGYMAVHPRYVPVSAVTAVAVGTIPSQLQSYADLSNVIVQPDRILVPIGPVVPFNSSQGPIQFGGGASVNTEAWCEYTYCNGWPVTTMTEGAAQGATSIAVADTTGIIEGRTQLTIYAGRQRTTFIAGAVSTAPAAGLVGTGPGTVGCDALPFGVSYANGIYEPFVTGQPPSIQEACSLVVRSFIKSRGGGNVSMSTSAGGSTRAGDGGAGEDLKRAESILMKYQARE